jgi:sigma-54 dependent transcriptional regulator, acetoin dehydrogenase operon transcriptional activator AcoR
VPDVRPEALGAAPIEVLGSTLTAADSTAENTTSPTTPRLRESDLDLIQKTLRACGGNVSHAAKRLGVSRGLIYRRLRESQATNIA